MKEFTVKCLLVADIIGCFICMYVYARDIDTFNKIYNFSYYSIMILVVILICIKLSKHKAIQNIIDSIRRK